MILLGDNLDARTAAMYGITHRAADSEDKLDTLVNQWSRRIARRNPTATHIAKRALHATEALTKLGDLSVIEDDLFLLGARTTGS